MDKLGVNVIGGIYVDLDSIFDTRLTILKTIDRNIYSNIINDTEMYNMRLINEFDYINFNIFKDMYKLRNNNILQNSKVTKIMELLMVEMDILVSKRIESGESPIIDITINTYPYTLNKKEEERLSSLFVMFGKVDNIKFNFVNIDFKQITLTYISEFNLAFMYNALEWLDYHVSIDSGEAVTTKLYGPALLLKPVMFKTDKDLDMLFNMQTDLYSRYISYTPIPIEFFNIRMVYIYMLRKEKKI